MANRLQYVVRLQSALRSQLRKAFQTASRLRLPIVRSNGTTNNMMIPTGRQKREIIRILQMITTMCDDVCLPLIQKNSEPDWIKAASYSPNGPNPETTLTPFGQRLTGASGVCTRVASTIGVSSDDSVDDPGIGFGGATSRCRPHAGHVARLPRRLSLARSFFPHSQVIAMVMAMLSGLAGWRNSSICVVVQPRRIEPPRGRLKPRQCGL